MTGVTPLYFQGMGLMNILVAILPTMFFFMYYECRHQQTYLRELFFRADSDFVGVVGRDRVNFDAFLFSLFSPFVFMFNGLNYWTLVVAPRVRPMRITAYQWYRVNVQVAMWDNCSEEEEQVVVVDVDDDDDDDDDDEEEAVDVFVVFLLLRLFVCAFVCCGCWGFDKVRSTILPFASTFARCCDWCRLVCYPST